MYKYASEFSLVGQIEILPPFVRTVHPINGITLNRPFVLKIEGMALSGTDVVKATQGTTCEGPISSRPYFSQVVITDAPLRTKAEVTLVLTGPGVYTDGKRKLCYSYDAGVTFSDTGFTLSVVSPKATAAVPTQLSLSASRKVSVYGEAITQGDRVKVVKMGSTCYGTSDTDGIVLGGEGRELIVDAKYRLPFNIGLEAWPDAATRGASEFLLPREDPAVLCYLHRDGAGWTPIIGEDGKVVEISIRDTWDLAQGMRSGAGQMAGVLSKWPALALGVALALALARAT